MNKKKILMVVSHFYPNGSVVEGKNNYLTMLELERGGYEVDVCTFKGTKKYSKNVKYLINRKNKLFSNQNGYYSFFRKKIKFPLLPVDFSYVNDFSNVLYNIDILQYNYIYTVFGDGSEHIVGMKLKEKYKHLKHIAEFRDPWIHNEILKKYFFDNSFRFYANTKWNELKQLQSNLLKKIDLLLVESESHADLIRKDFNYKKDILICNGYSTLFKEKIFDLDIEFKKKPVIGFVGATYYGYDDVADIFIEVLEELEDEGLNFTFISVGNNRFSELANSSKLKNFYAFHKVPYIKAMAFMKKLDIGLAITMKNYENHINSKIFEYMQNGIYTIAIAPKNGAMDKILSENNLGCILSYEKKRMKEELYNLLKTKKDFKINLDKAKKYDRKNVFEKILTSIGKL